MSGRHRPIKHVGHRRMICLGKYETTEELMDFSELGIRLTKKKKKSVIKRVTVSLIIAFFSSHELYVSGILT